jgi:uncharacterized RDD family membrane protein YckC
MIFASLWQRFEAFLLDYLIIAAYLILLVIVSVGLGFGPMPASGASQAGLWHQRRLHQSSSPGWCSSG